MGEDTDRPQDAGRQRTRRGSPSPATRTLLARYQGSMRAELSAILDELEPQPPAPGLGLVEEPAKRPDVKSRAALWSLAITLGRELGTEIDATAPAGESPAAARPPRRSRKVDYG